MMDLKDMLLASKNNLFDECMKIIDNYTVVYKEYYTSGSSADSAVLKDLVDSLIGISAVLEVYVRDGKVHPEYAIEKLERSMSYFKSAISYYESRLKNESEG